MTRPRGILRAGARCARAVVRARRRLALGAAGALALGTGASAVTAVAAAASQPNVPRVLASQPSPSAPNAETGSDRGPSAPTPGALANDGQDNRYLLGGAWLLRLDPGDVGIARRYWADDAATAGWKAITVPNSFNAGDLSKASFAGSVAWYRRDFTLPSRAFASYVPTRARSWVIDFTSVNYRATVWLNGHRLGTHAGASLPFEFALKHLRPGVNRLVVRVDNELTPADFPRSKPGAGWWNFGGILDAVYLRPVARAEIAGLRIRTPVACRGCAARIEERATVRNLTGSAQTVSLRGRYGSAQLDFGHRRLAPGATWAPTATVMIAHPRLWNPGAARLYRATLTLRDASGRRLTGYTLISGIRTITVRHGILRVNGRQVHLRGVNLHEQTATTGAALSLAAMRRLINWAKGLGATIIRAHYPLNPELEELADRAGIMLWSEVPVYHPPVAEQASGSWRRAAVRLLAHNIEANQDHPSILLWSIGNELNVPPVPGQAAYIKQAALLAHRLDPTRPVGIAVYDAPWSCEAEYRPLQVIGVNAYFGWFQAGGALDNRQDLGPFMRRVHACYPNKAVFVSEFGYGAAEPGPVELRGTYQNQISNIEYALSVFRTEPWLAGAIYHILQDWASSPGWDGLDPLGAPPIVDKGLIDRDGTLKPAYAVVRRLYRATTQLAPARR